MVTMNGKNNQICCISSSNFNNTINNSSNIDSKVGSEFTEDELEVANTLLNLPYLVAKSVSSYNFSYFWTPKKRRSVLDKPPKPRKSTSPKSHLHLSNGRKSNKICKPKTSTKGKREELRQIMEERVVIPTDTVVDEDQKLKMINAENNQVKHKKQEVLEQVMDLVDMRRKEAQLEDYERPINSVPVVHDHVFASPSTSARVLHQPPLVNDDFNHAPIVHAVAQIPQDFQAHNQLRPLEFDLNVEPIIEERPILTKESAKQARLIRMVICRAKKRGN